MSSNEEINIASEESAVKDTLIFDLDGTLLNTLEDLMDSVNFALSQFSYPQRTLDEIKNFVGNGVEMLIARAIPQGRDNPNFDSCLGIFKEHYANNMENKTAPYDGIMDMLASLKEKGFKMAIVSNKFDVAVKALADKFFCGFMDCALGESPQTGKKPDPEIVYKAISDMSSNKSNAFYIGDSEVDCKTAQNASVDLIAVSWGFRSPQVLRENGAKIIINTPAELTEYLIAQMP